VRSRKVASTIELLTIAEAAKIARVPRRIITYAMEAGWLEYVPYSRNTRRILLSDLKRWIKKRRTREIRTRHVPSGYAALPPV
jgi:hypothetical protein